MIHRVLVCTATVLFSASHPASAANPPKSAKSTKTAKPAKPVKPVTAIPVASSRYTDPESKTLSTFRGDLSLGTAVSIALKQNPDLLKALKEIERTRGQVIEVRAQALPHLVLDASYRQEDKDLLELTPGSSSASSFTLGSETVSLASPSGSSSFGRGDKNWLVTIEVRQLIYSGGQVTAALKIAKYTEDQTYFLLRDVVDRIIAQVRSQFYAVLLNRKLITVAEESLRLLEDELKDQRNRFDAGTVPRFNVLRAEVAVANSRPDLIRARNNYLIAQLELAKTLGFDAEKIPRATLPFNAVGELRAIDRSINLSHALTVAKERRPFLKAQKQTILTEEQQIIVAAAGNKPQLSANGGWEFHNSRRTDDISKEANGWYFGVIGSWNIFDGFETKGKVIQARARLASARINYSDSVHQVELEVQRAYASVQEARELIASQGKVVEQAEETLRLARERLGAGAGTQLEVLDAQVALTRARTTEQEALYDFNVAIAEFDRSTGANTVYDNTFEDPRENQNKSRLRAGKAELRPEQ